MVALRAVLVYRQARRVALRPQTYSETSVRRPGLPVDGGCIRPRCRAKVPPLGPGKTAPPITISGGINAWTADWLREDEHQRIAGVGMGTVARQAVWSLPDDLAEQTAARLVSRFRNPKSSC